MAAGDQQDLFYEPRFLDSYAGPIISNPTIAIVELVANCWDAYATEVKILWPNKAQSRQFSIADNGKGMTLDEFKFIWRAMSYDRIKRYGPTVDPPPDVTGLPRDVFGRNGKGRFASFCFSSEYVVSSRKDGQAFSCRVSRSPLYPLVIEDLDFQDSGAVGHGTTITGSGEIQPIQLQEDQAREILGSRFLANPAFHVYLNERRITFGDISAASLSIEEIDIPNLGMVKIHHIDTQKADRTTKQHGIAWWVQKRAVGECKWHGSDVDRILDGRSSEAKRYTFIVEADFLNAANAVKEDWSGFNEENPAWREVQPIVQQRIREIIARTNQATREDRRNVVFDRVGSAVNALPPLGKDRVKTFINEIIDSCPNFGDQEIIQLSTILTKLEKSKSLYGLLDVLHAQDPDDLDSLHGMLREWTIGMAKIVLDEIQTRLRLIGELRIKLQKAGVNEVQELQPLFEKGLWMFGAQFESIEFTSNKGMTTVGRELFGDKSAKNSLNRPDFVVLDDCTIGLYARSSYDDDFNENGVEHVVIVDLKTTKLPIGSKEKEQVWKYVKELRQRGYLTPRTRVDGFVLGDEIDPSEREPRTEGDSVKIAPMLYETILIRAERRLLNLSAKVKDAPFLVEQQEKLASFLDAVPVVQGQLNVDAASQVAETKSKSTRSSEPELRSGAAPTP